MRWLLQHSKRVREGLCNNNNNSRKKQGCMSVAFGYLMDSPRQVAELLTDTFASVCIDNDPVRPAAYQVYGGRMHVLNITVEKVFAALQLSVPLAMLFNHLFETESLPEVWLESIVVATII